MLSTEDGVHVWSTLYEYEIVEYGVRVPNSHIV